MKKIFLIITIVITFTSCLGTDQGESKIFSYKVINASNKSITIKSFYNYNTSIDPIITNINIGEEVVKSETDYPPGYGETNFRRFFGEERDSIVIIYNSEKIESFLYECSSNNRNPLNFCIYNNLEEIFTFTQEDYNNAEDCNGNCD